MRKTTRIIAIASSLALTTALHAAPFTWDGGGASKSWGDAANWDPDGAPTLNNTTELIFYKVGTLQSDTEIDGNHRTINKLTFTADADADVGIRLGTEGDGNRLYIDGAGCGIFIAAGAEGNITIGTSAQSYMQIRNGALFSEAGKGMDIDHQGTGELIFDRDIRVQTNPGSLKKSGSGTLTLNDDLRTTGTFYLSGGRVNINTARSGGNAGVSWIIEPGITLGNTTTAAVVLDVDPTITINGDFTYDSPDSRDLNLGTGAVTLANNVTITCTGTGGAGGNATLKINGDIDDGGSGFILTKAGAENLELGGTGTYSGGTVISDGVLITTNGNALGSGPITNNAELELQDSADYIVAGAISGTGSVVQNGTGTATLSGALSYGGTTTVNSGGIVLTNSHTGAGAYTVASGATLGGDGGSIDNDVTVAASGSFDPGKNGFALTGTTNDIGGSTFLLEVDGTGANEFDSVSCSGTLDITDAVLDTTGSDIVYNAGHVAITIIDCSTSAVTGTFLGLAESDKLLIGSQVFQITYAGGGDSFDVVLTPLAESVITIAVDTDEVIEGSSAGFTITANPAPTAGNITVNLSYSGTAADGTDYTGSLASVDVLNTQSTAALSLSAVDDGVLEGPESLTVTVDSVSGAPAFLGSPGTASLFILDGDSAPADGAALTQTIIDAGSPVDLDDIVVSDEAGGTSQLTGLSVEPMFVYNGLLGLTEFGAGFSGTSTTDQFTLSPVPDHLSGFSLEVEFTPTADDVALAKKRVICEIGGLSNGCGLYLIDGKPIFLAKMDSAGANQQSGRNDFDWESGTADGAVSRELTLSPLTANERVQIALEFEFDTLNDKVILTFSVNGGATTAVDLTTVGTRTNWPGGTPGVSIGTTPGTTLGGTNDTGGDFLNTSFESLENGGAAVSVCRWWNAADGTFSLAAGSADTVTATLEVRGHVDDATSGELTGAEYGDESGIWTKTGTLADVNAALAAVQFVPGTDTFSIIDITLSDTMSGGTTTGAIVFATTGPTIVYVDDSFTESIGDAITDADQGQGGDQTATFGYDAFRSIQVAHDVVTTTGTVIVNVGDYSAETVAIAEDVVLRLSGGDVTIGSLNASEFTTIELQANSITLGNDSTDNTIDAVISGTGGLTKVGTDQLTLRNENTYTGTTTVSTGTLRIASQDLVLVGSIDSPVAVALDALLEFVPVEGGMITHSTAISGAGSVSTDGHGTVVFDGPANTFTGGLDLGDGTGTTYDGIDGAIHGFVVISNGNQLGNGLISARGSQLQASAPGVDITNDIECLGGSLRTGGSNDLEFSGTVTAVGGNNRTIGNYGLEGLTITFSGTIDTDDGLPREVNFGGSGGEDNGAFVVSGSIIDAGSVEVVGSFVDGVVTFTGANTYAGRTAVNGGTLILDGTHFGATDDYTVGAGDVLGGSGTTDATVIVNAGGTLAPGTSTGKLTVGGLTVTGTLEIEINDTTTPGVDYDQVVVNGTVTINSGAALNLIEGASVIASPAAETVIVSNDALDAVTGSFAGLLEGDTASGDFLGSGQLGVLSYVGGTDTNDIVIDASTQSPIGVWRNAFFGDPKNTGAGANANDPNLNGYSNLMDFAFGFDPLTAGSGFGAIEVIAGAITSNGQVTVYVDSGTGQKFLRYPRRTDYLTAGLEFIQWFSNDLFSFEETAETEAVVGTGTGADGNAIEAVDIEFPASLPISALEARFGRIEVGIAP